LAAIERELANYAEAIAASGPLPALLTAMEARERRRAALAEQLTALAVAPASEALPDDVARGLRARLSDWQDVLRGQPEHARTILARLLAGRLVMTPRETTDGERVYDFAGQGSVTELLTGVADTRGVVTPAGFARLWPFVLEGDLRGAA
jgi:hypothetical protein